MGNAIISRRGGGYATIKFENYNPDGNTLVKANSPTALNAGRTDLAGASVGNYALFVGGYGSSTYADVYAYNASLTRSTTTTLSQARYSLAGASVGDYALFAGGLTYSSTSGYILYTKVDAYNSSLTRSTPTSLSVGRCNLAGASVGNYALFAGGYSSYAAGTYIGSSVVNAYNTSLVRSTPTSLSQARGELAATSVGDYALFAGGHIQDSSSTNYSTVDAYSTSLTRSTSTALSSTKYCLAGANVGNYALFAGGFISGTIYSTVDAYNTSLVKSTPTALSEKRFNLAGASAGNYALFAGGSSGTYTPVVDAYDTSLTRSTTTALSQARWELAGASVGNYALFGGGSDSSSKYSTVDAYESMTELTIFKDSKYKFQNMSAESTVSSAFETITVPSPITGYVKVKNTTIS